MFIANRTDRELDRSDDAVLVSGRLDEFTNCKKGSVFHLLSLKIEMANQSKRKIDGTELDIVGTGRKDQAHRWIYEELFIRANYLPIEFEGRVIGSLSRGNIDSREFVEDIPDEFKIRLDKDLKKVFKRGEELLDTPDGPGVLWTTCGIELVPID